MKRILFGAAVVATALVLGGAGLVQPAVAQTKSKMCANGFPEWANEAFTTRNQGNFRCDPVTGSAAKAAQPQTKAAPAPRPQVAKVPKAKPADLEQAATASATPVAKAEPQDSASSGSSSSVSSGTTATPSAKPQCRRYLASTGQTVEVPCS